MSTTAKYEGKLFNKNYILILLANACASIGFYFVQPTLARYITGLGISLVVAGVVTGMFSLIALVFRPITGIVADRICPRSILLVVLPMEAVAGAFYGLIPHTWWLIICRTFHGIGFAFAGTVLIVYASLFIPSDHMGEGLGYLGVANVIGTAIGPSLGLGIGAVVGYEYSFLVGGIIIFIGFIMILFTKMPAGASTTAEKKKIKLSELISVKLIPLSFLNGLFGLTNGIVTSFLSLHADERGIANIGLYFTILAIAMVVTRPFTGKLNDKKGLNFIAIPGFIFSGSGLFLIATAHSFIPIAIAAVFMALGQGATQPAIQNACIKQVPEDERGVATSTYYLFADVFNGVGPMVGSEFATITSVGQTIVYQPMYTANSIVMFCGLFLYIIYAAISKKRGIKL